MMMIKRICEIMLAVVLVELWASVVRVWMDFDVDDNREWMELRVGDEGGRIGLNVADEKGWIDGCYLDARYTRSANIHLRHGQHSAGFRLG